MQFPEQPTCHGETRFGPTEWRVRPFDGWQSPETFRTCSYCGSIHPEDLLTALSQGATLGGSDWKYGWPHKFYIHGIPNPIAGQEVKVGESSGQDEDGTVYRYPIMGTAGPLHAKWYNEHLQDAGFDDEAMTALLDALTRHSGITFKRDDAGQLVYQAPYHGYQH